MGHKAVNKIATKHVDNGVVTFKFMDGTDLVCDPAELPQAMIGEMLAYGIKNKVGDKYAKSESVEDAVSQATHLWENLKRGVFNEKGVGGGGDVVTATMKLFEITYNEALAAWQGKSKEEQAAFKRHPKIALIILQIQQKRAAEKLKALDTTDIDTSDLPTL